jgi:hypothetical protein
MRGSNKTLAVATQKRLLYSLLKDSKMGRRAFSGRTHFMSCPDHKELGVQTTRTES